MTALFPTAMLRSHYRNYGEHKGIAALNSELSKLSLYNLIVQSSQSPFVGYWHPPENQEISLVKTIEHLPEAGNYLFS